MRNAMLTSLLLFASAALYAADDTVKKAPESGGHPMKENEPMAGQMKHDAKMHEKKMKDMMQDEHMQGMQKGEPAK